MDYLAHLTAIGFSEYEAKVYLALLGESPATGYQIGKSAGIARSMVYEALGRLESRGAVLKKEDRRATLYRPVPPDILLDRYEQEQLSLLGSLRKELQAVYAAQPRDDFWTVKGRNTALSYAGQLIDGAKEELMLVLNDADIEALTDKIEGACNRGVAVKALLTGDQSLTCGEIAYHPPLESELQQLSDMMVVVADRGQVLIASDKPDAAATITNNRNMVLIAHQFIWMELFTQRINARLDPELLSRLAPEDRQILASHTRPERDGKNPEDIT